MNAFEIVEAPEIRYTDRNVRESPGLTTLAIDFLKSYGGEFEPIVNAKNYLITTGNVPTVMVRTVLNCMRLDPRWTKRLEMATLSPLSRDPQEPTRCTLTEPHSSHSIRSGGSQTYQMCKGVPWAIDRSSYALVAKVKYPLATSRTGALVHQVDPEGEHYITWWPNYHELGFMLEPALTVKLLCKYPSYLHKPQLLKAMPSTEAMALRGLQPCLHCARTLSEMGSSS